MQRFDVTFVLVFGLYFFVFRKRGSEYEGKVRRSRMRTNCKEALDLLAKIRADGGRQKLNKLGEWLATNPEPLFTWDEKDLKYIMK